MISYKNIHQTDKTRDTIGEETQAWIDLNKADGRTLDFLDDSEAERWVEEMFLGSDVDGLGAICIEEC